MMMKLITLTYILVTIHSGASLHVSDFDLEETIKFLQPLSQIPIDNSATFSHENNNNDSLVLTALGDDIVKEYGAYCLDKSSFGYYFRPSTNLSSSNKWVIYLEGGGLCIERKDCETRVNKTDGSSINWEPYLTGTDNLVSSSKLNPFNDWNHIYLRYCSGDTWTGTNIDSPGRFGLWFSGHNQIEATLHHLNLTQNLYNNEETLEIMFAGASAGGIGVNNNCDYVADTLLSGYDKAASTSITKATSTKPIIRCTPQSGMFFPPETTTLYEERLNIKISMNKASSLYLTELYSSFLDESCVDYTKEIGDAEKFCWEASYLTPHIETKLFIAQNFWDKFQLNYLLCYDSDVRRDKCTDKYMEEFKNHTLTQLYGLSGGTLTSTSVGVWAPSCVQHTGDTCLVPSVNDGQSTLVQNVLYRDALTMWMEDDENPPVLIDDCIGFKSDSRPCNRLCSPGCNGDQ